MKYFVNSKGRVFAFEEDGSQDDLIPKDLKPISDKDLKALQDQKEKDLYNSLTYQQKRIMEYPSIGDQLDALYHAGMLPKDLSAQIKTIKDKYPKA